MGCPLATPVSAAAAASALALAAQPAATFAKPAAALTLTAAFFALIAAALALATTTSTLALALAAPTAALAITAAAFTITAASLAITAAALVITDATLARAAVAQASLREVGGLRVGDRSERLDEKESNPQLGERDGRGEGSGQGGSRPVLYGLYQSSGALLCGVLQRDCEDSRDMVHGRGQYRRSNRRYPAGRQHLDLRRLEPRR